MTNNYSNDYALKIQTKLITQSVVHKFSNLKSKKDRLEISKVNIEKEREKLLKENENLRQKMEILREKVKIFEMKFEDIKKSPEIYDGLDEDYLKYFINTEIWADSRNQLIKNYFSNDFNGLSEKSKKELIFMRVIFNIMSTGYDICAFLLAKVVERELRRIIFKSFKNYWKSNLRGCEFSITVNDKNYFDSNPNLWNSLLRTNDIFLDYLKGKHLLVLGNISKILKELSLYCKLGSSKKLLLGWESSFLLAFKTNLCLSVNKILDGLYSEISSKKGSIQFINLRNLVSHADDVEPEIKSYRNIEFDEFFIKNLLEFMTIKDPMLLKEICNIKPL